MGVLKISKDTHSITIVELVPQGKMTYKIETYNVIYMIHLIWIYVAVIKHGLKSTQVGKRLSSLHIVPNHVGSQDRNLEGEYKAESTKECLILVKSSGLLSYLSHTA